MATSIDTENSISLRFKFGPQTIFLFVECRATLADISDKLLDALRQRYPHGLARNTGLPDAVPIPKAGEPCTVAYALPKIPRDLAAGWKPLDARDTDTPLSLRLRENAVLAFVIQAADAAPASASDFHVEIPDDE